MSLPILYFKHPEPDRYKHRLYPVFLPFAGCTFQCIYCSQEAQTGQQPKPLEQMVQRLNTNILLEFRKNRKPFSLGFFGGTFTALSRPNQKLFLETALELKRLGAVNHVRCSTRPDCMDQGQIRLLKDYGMDMVELGVQSFDNRVLSLSRRGYVGKEALNISRLLKKNGLELGIQLMPGLPGSDAASFSRDLETTAQIQPAAVRLYPCLVLEGTVLARHWSKGMYRPWSLNTTLTLTSNALLRMWLAGIPVIRTGLAPEASLLPRIKAGPWHPALGAICRGRALGAYVTAMASRLGAGPLKVLVPKKYISDFWGHGKENEKLYQRSGIFRENVTRWNHELFMLADHATQLP
ncbi:radical SAM protein [Desulfonatronospira sp.]|uniref:elongator complex protein 3 n=1 Tax=Desulfonatronospira sp. TaxID=1962951 RepID=UPI0025C0A2AD|nr:radical SAM protein [Desulfonatronospira sp.]